MSNQFRLWAMSCAHVGSDIREGRESLADAIRHSERDFDWENNIRISYEGEEDDIVQKVEAGNISLSLPATQFVTFSGQNSGLFGLKAISKIGPVDVTTIASIEKTKKEQLKYKGSNESSIVKIKDSDYIKNQYFYIHKWFRNGIDTTLKLKNVVTREIKAVSYTHLTLPTKA